MKSRLVRTTSVAMSVAALAACSIDRPASPLIPNPTDASLSTVPGQGTGRYLVKYSAGLSAARASITARGAKVDREIPTTSLVSVSGLTPSTAAALAKQPGIAAVVEDQLLSWIPTPSSLVLNTAPIAAGPGTQGTDQSGAFFYAAWQWNIKIIQANVAWGQSNGGLGETVCVLDTGVDPTHNDLNGKVVPSLSGSVILVPRFPSDATVLDFNSHGTYVSAIVSSNGLGVASVAPDAKLCAIKVLSQDGFGTFGDIIYGIFVAAKLGVDVINMSLTGIVDASNPNNAGLLRLLQEVIDAARNRGALVVAAAGNNGLNFDDIPANFLVIPAMMKGVLSVGATGPINQQNFDRLASYSNFGGTRTLDLVAPGGEFIAGTVPQDLVISACSTYQVTLPFTCAVNSYIISAGTSAAAPHVAGAGAVVESNAPGGAMPSPALEKCILDGTDKLLPKWKFGRGRLNVAKAAFCEGAF